MPKGIPASGKRATKETARKITYSGITSTVDEWAALHGLSPQTIRARIRRGWTPEHSILNGITRNPAKPPPTTKYVMFRGKEVQRIVAEKALGKPIPKGAEVHHVDLNGRNNNNGNLVICPSKEYHRLLHIRTDALLMSGNANNRKCYICGKYDNPEHMYFKTSKANPNGSCWHRECHSEKEAKRKAACQTTQS